jgi:hypothetical protein
VNDGDFEIVVVTLMCQRVEFANFARLAEEGLLKLAGVCSLNAFIEQH